jgi:hypothetical protein
LRFCYRRRCSQIDNEGAKLIEITAFEEFCQQYPEVLALRHQQLVGV